MHRCGNISRRTFVSRRCSSENGQEGVGSISESGEGWRQVDAQIKELASKVWRAQTQIQGGSAGVDKMR